MTISHNGKTQKFYPDEIKVAAILHRSGNVNIKSEFSKGSGNYIKSLYIPDEFAKVVWNEEWALANCPKFVQKFAAKHPRAQQIVYCTKPRLIKKLINQESRL
tara:strand:- start:24990 stop:25298 length:309 start_codon:yes stop_codon:yes gene_type:complete